MDTCATCRCYTAPPAQPPVSVGIVVHGVCRRFPQAVAKKPDDWCFEFKTKAAPKKPQPAKGKKAK